MSGKIRQLIADAASTVDGVHVTPHYRQVTKPGQGMVRVDRIDYPNPFGGVVTWQVMVVLPQDIAQAEKWLDENGSVLRQAVAEELIVRSMTPQQLALDTGAIPVVVIEGQREEE